MATVECLHSEVGANPHVEFCAVRPSDMSDGAETAYTLHDTLQNGMISYNRDPAVHS